MQPSRRPTAPAEPLRNSTKEAIDVLHLGGGTDPAPGQHSGPGGSFRDSQLSEQGPESGPHRLRNWIASVHPKVSRSRNEANITQGGQ